MAIVPTDDGRFAPLISSELSSWLDTHYYWESDNTWRSNGRDGFLMKTVEIPDNLKDEVATYLLDKQEARRQNGLIKYKDVWSALGVPYSDNPALAAAAELGNGAGIELIKQQEGQLSLEEKVAVLSSLYEQALSNWEKELKRANKLQRIVDSYRVRPPAEVPWIYDGNVCKPLPKEPFDYSKGV